MAKETATYIGQLVPSNPVATDGLAQADDHIRMIKSTIQNTFPNINGPVTSSPADLNKLDTYTGNTADLNLLSGLSSAAVTNTNVGHLAGVSSNIQTQLNNLSSGVSNTNAAISSAVPTGMIMLWSGASTAIPSGYVLCNGSNGTPDLRNRFVVGHGSSYAVGATGGASSVTLTTAQMPSHTHTYEDKYVGLVYNSLARLDIDYNTNVYDQNGSRTGTTNSAGSGQSHENRPPYYALCYVMKT